MKSQVRKIAALRAAVTGAAMGAALWVPARAGEPGEPVVAGVAQSQAAAAGRETQSTVPSSPSARIDIGTRAVGDAYGEIVGLREKAVSAYRDGRWQETVDLAGEIQERTSKMVRWLRREAGDDLAAVKAGFQRLVDEGGRTHALMYVQHIEEHIKGIEEHLSASRGDHLDYMVAHALAKQALADVESGIVETKRKKCEVAIERIQRKLIEAQGFRAEFFIPELWNAASDDFARLVENFWKKEYDFVLAAAPQLEAQVDVLLLETRKADSAYRLDKLGERIVEMRADGVQKQLPDLFARVEKALREARAAFKAERLEDSRNIVTQAESLAKRMDTTVFIETSLGKIAVRVVNGQDVIEKIHAAEEGTVVIRSVARKTMKNGQ